MATSILTPGMTAENSDEFTVGDDEEVIVSIYTDTGADMPAGVALLLQRADINDNFISVATPGFGRIFFSRGCQQVLINTPGTYRVSRTDITVWGTNVGIQTGI